MHEGHHGILEDPKKKGQHHHGHGHDHDHDHDHDHHHDHKPARAGQAQSERWMQVVAAAVVGVLVIGFLLWKFL